MEPSGGTFDGDVTDLEERLTDKLYALWRPRNELAPGMWEAYAESLPLVVFTGGEPSIQLHAKSEVAGRFLRAMRHVFPTALFSMETNGARMPHPYIQWVTLSPKHPFKPQPRLVPDEIKVLFPLYEEEIVKVWIPWVKKRRGLDGAEFVFVQPVDSAGCTEENTRRAVAFVHQYADLARLSVQTHKIVGVP
jgi:organic radical activating enzyme